MIDLLSKFRKHEKTISEFIVSQIEYYYKSKCFEILKERVKTLQESNDLKPQSTQDNYFISQVVFPIVKERALIRRAVTSSNYRSNDLFTLNPLGATTAEQAAMAETVLNLNMANTFFKMKSLKPAINVASKFGSSVMYTYWRVQDQAEMRTTYDEQTGTYARVRSYKSQKNAVSDKINVTDYFQNPDISEPELSDYQGHYRTMRISELTVLLNDETYIKSNVKKAIEDLKKGVESKTRKDCNDEDLGKWYVKAAYFEGVITIPGNEDDFHRYRAQLIGNTIIRWSVDDYDKDLRSYTVLNFDKRDEYWWGHPDSEYVVAHENFLNTFLSLSADNALRSMQQYVFFRKDTISPADISNAESNNNFVPVDGKNTKLSDLLAPFQPGTLNLNPAQFITQMVNDSVQRMSTKVDLSRKSEAGGVQNNSTATAANIIANQSDVQESDLLENMDFCVSLIGLKSLIMLQQFLSDIFWIKPNAKEQQRPVDKWEILGDMSTLVNTTASKNKQNELLRMQNLATWLLNVLTNPQMQQAGYNVAPIVRDILQKAELPSVEEVIPKENEVQAVPGMTPSVPFLQQPQTGGTDNVQE